MTVVAEVAADAAQARSGSGAGVTALTFITESDRKRFATLQAMAMLKGVTVKAFMNDAERPEFLVMQFALTAFADSLDNLERHLRRFGVEIEGRLA